MTRRIIKEYYNLKEITSFVDIKYRQLKIRVNEVSRKYDRNLIHKKNNQWYIHRSIVKEFSRKRRKIDYKYFITITPEGKYPFNFLRTFVNHIISQVRQEDSPETIKYVLETKNDRNHIHIMTTYNNQPKFRKMLKGHSLSETKLNLHFKKLYFQYEINHKHEYMRKQNRPILVHCNR